ncbi:MAG: hypothetical protein ACLFQ0_15980, partial [Cyclobacteriaceae bacterium]
EKEVQFTTNEKGERVVVIREKTYHQLQKKLEKLSHIEKTMQAFREIKDMKEGKAKEKDAFDLLDEL